MSFRVVAKVLDHSSERLARRLILIVLAEAASDDGIAFLEQEKIAQKALLARTHVGEKLSEMEAERVIEIRKAKRGRKRFNVYRLVSLPGLDDPNYDRLPFDLDEPFTTSELPTPSPIDDVGTTGSTTSEPQGKALALSSSCIEPPIEPKDRVLASWVRLAPPLIAHRPAYFETSPARTAVKNALKVYPPETVEQAIENYATCLASPAYRWTYSWTFVDFLRRGLDRFVPEAEPLRNFAAPAQRATGPGGAANADELLRRAAAMDEADRERGLG